MTYDLAGDIARALDAQDADRPKFAVGETVWVLEREVTITRMECIEGQWHYAFGKHTLALWAESWLTSADDHTAQMAQRTADTEAREIERKERYDALLLMKPSRSLYESDADFEWAYVQWAESFWGCGNMPEPVRRLYNRYMLTNRWTVLS